MYCISSYIVLPSSAYYNAKAHPYGHSQQEGDIPLESLPNALLL